MRGGDGAGRGESKKCKPIPAPPRPAPWCGLKSRPIPAPSPLRGGENPHGTKRGGAGQAGQGKIAIPSPKPTQKGGVLIYNFIESMGVLYLVGNYLENGQYISDS